MKNPGFSLIEVLVSSSLILFLLIGSAQLILTSIGARRNADFHLAATILASSHLEQLKSLSFDDPLFRSGSQNEIVRSTIVGEDFLMERRIQDLTQGIKEVDLTVARKSRPSQKVTLIALYCREFNF